MKPSPTVAAITGAATLCGNASTQLATTATGGVWSSSDEAIATVDQSGLVTGVAGGPGGAVVISYSVTANGCTGAATHNLNVNTPGVISPTTGTTDVCIGGTITLANATPDGVWSSSDVNVATVSNGVITTVAAGTATISYTVTDVNGCSGAADAVVTVHALPAAPVIAGSTGVCESEQITLSSVTTGGIWSVDNTAIATVGAANGTVTGVTPGSALITYTITDQYACSNAGTYNITVNPAATVAAITGANSVCVNSSIVLANTTGGGTWSSGDATIALVNATTGEVTGVAEGAATVSYMVTNASGCAATATFVVNVRALPVVPAITGTNSICIGTSTTLANMVSGGVWSSDDAPVATVDATTGEVTGISAGTATINYTYTNANGCATTRTFDMEVNTAVTVPAFTGGNSVCVGGVLDLDNTVTGGVWTSDNTAAATVNAATGQVTGISGGTTNITYTLTVATGCSGSYTAAITVNALPATPVIAGTNEVCVGGTITLNGDVAGTGSSGSNAIATVSAAGVVTGVSAGSTSIILTVTNANGCTNNASYSITVKAKPGIGAITGGSVVCEGEVLYLGNAASGGVWTSDNNSVATVSTSGVVSGLANGTANITYTVTGGGCSNTAGNVVTVNQTPVVPAIGGATAVCEGQPST
ncbi:Ig-like domain-containing protein [Chitinophaga sedimenti]|uniref:beta strand repeat-containing protein n=1 Tax=Chitinophaga sedimenti TaxID=2033606 RepID=UPI002003BC84|nr:Ig-like domain-containing protein [Chitinophaga sedimenti]MCK7558363.1 Ig-like domain-containing protein [Chitinophaga sedimenti]